MRIRNEGNGFIRNSYRTLAVVFGAFFLIAFFSGCSSAPKKPLEIYTDRDIAANQLNLANYAANRGRYEEALRLLAEARRLAVTTDDPEMRIKTSMSKGNILFAMGNQAEALPELEKAAAEGETSGEKVLAALARIYIIRCKLRLQEEGAKDSAAIKELTNQLLSEMAVVRSDTLASASAYVTLALAEKLAERWAEGESAARRALDIHERGLFFEDAAYDWFVIASIRSVAGNYDSAIAALNQAINFDRRAENGFGLASSWQALGDVYQKAGRTEESRLAYRRSAEIFRAIDFTAQAEKLEAQTR